jgi:hypothetical protein
MDETEYATSARIHQHYVSSPSLIPLTSFVFAYPAHQDDEKLSDNPARQPSVVFCFVCFLIVPEEDQHVSTNNLFPGEKNRSNIKKKDASELENIREGHEMKTRSHRTNTKEEVKEAT